MAVDLVGVEEIGASVRATFGLTYEIEGLAKPACVVEVLSHDYA